MPRFSIRICALATILCVHLAACGSDDSSSAVTPLDTDFVLTVFELEATARGPCTALTRLSGEELGESGWKACFPKQNELLMVLDCRREGEDVLYEGTGRVTGWEENRAGWEFFTRRTTLGGLEIALSGQGEGEIGLGMREGERVAFVDLEIRHQTGTHSIEGALRYEGNVSVNSSILLHRRVGESRTAPWLCVVFEFH